MSRFALLALAACSSSPSTTTATTPVATPAVTPDAAPPPPDAPSATDGALATAEPQVFRYNAPPRVETWTMRIAGDRASVVVAGANEMTYLGTFVDGKLEVATSSAKLSLQCTKGKLANVGEANAERRPPKKGKPCAFVPAKTTTLDVWLCKHPDFEAPMPFAASPGIEYVGPAEPCTGGAYRRAS